jgi:hypothetical protein
MELSRIAILMALALGLMYAPLLLMPEKGRAWLRAFPRSRWPAWVLTAIGLAWGAWLLRSIPLGRFDFIRPKLWFITPAVFFLIVTFVDELLAPRALGALLLLIPAPILAAARWHDSAFRLVITVVAYVMVVKGILLVLGPYRFRKWTERFLPDDGRCKAWGVAGLCVAAIVLVLGLAVY